MSEQHAKFQVQYDPAAKLWEVRANDVTILQYVYGEEKDVNPSFRDVKTTSGEQITLYRPWDHPWHPGLFFSWKYIDGLNFWESMYAGQKNVPVTKSFTSNDKNTGFTQTLEYVTHEGNVLLHEDRQINIHEVEGGYTIEGQFSFTPAGGNDVTLDRTVVTEETPWGGYAGFSCRLARNFLNPVIATDQGTFTADEAHGKAFKWCDYAGKIDGYTEEKWAGVTLLDHPDNPRHPTKMLTYDYKDMQFLSAAFLYDEPYVLKAGETLTLRYSFYIHDGKIAPEQLERIWQSHAK